MTASALAPVLETFASIQGEGAFVGELQVFLRLRGCPVRCRWCDTPGSLGVKPEDSARVATPGGPERHETWATPFKAACWIAGVEPGAPRTVSVTGGEPLLWPDFLIELRGMLGERRMHLETAGGHPETLLRVMPVFDHVSLDLKLPADLDPPVEIASDGLDATPTAERAPASDEDWKSARRRSLALLADREASAKLVVAGGRSGADFQPLLEDVAELAPRMPVFIQPVTPCGGVESPDMDVLIDVAERARDLELATRVVPQVHRALGVP